MSFQQKSMAPQFHMTDPTPGTPLNNGCPLMLMVSGTHTILLRDSNMGVVWEQYAGEPKGFHSWGYLKSLPIPPVTSALRRFLKIEVGSQESPGHPEPHKKKNATNLVKKNTLKIYDFSYLSLNCIFFGLKHENLRNPPSIRSQASVEDPSVASTLHDACAICKTSGMWFLYWSILLVF